MEEESFEDEEIAAFMNEHYVCIKVDREERPDVDAVYMAAVQALTGSGGWPMSVWLTPEREPFFGGTYFPPRDGARGARRGFLAAARARCTRAYVHDQERVRAGAAGALVERRARADGDAGRGRRGEPPGAALIGDTVAAVQARVRRARRRAAPRAQVSVERADPPAAARITARTGDADALHDGGAHAREDGGRRHVRPARRRLPPLLDRRRWLVPHFEKMLYDNALLAVAYAEAYQVTGRRDFARVARETLDYVLREMTAPEGGFYSATDADSVGPDGKSEEGTFFVWSEAEIRARAAGRARETERFLAPLRRHRRRQLRGGEHPPRRAAPTRRRWAALARAARGALRRARAAAAAAARREDPGRLERPHDLGARRGRPRARRAPLRRGRRARGGLRARTGCGPTGGSRAASRTAARTSPGFLDDYAFLAAGPHRSLRGDASTAAGSRRRSRSPTRPSACSPIRRAAGS